MVAAYDSTTPPQYDPHTAGFLMYLPDGRGVITTGAYERYTYLATNYAAKVLREKGYIVNPTEGIDVYYDQYTNKLYTIKQEQLVLFLTYVSWLRNGVYQ